MNDLTGQGTMRTTTCSMADLDAARQRLDVERLDDPVRELAADGRPLV